jgi:alpha-L-fucosidase
MTGFLKDPERPGTLLEWRENLGSKFDADRWVRDFKETGASYLIFYDKWHDGLVNHDTKTTNYKTHRDFVREIADACHRAGLRLVIYFNPHIDGNPDFQQWAVHDANDQPILMSTAWPFESQSLHSPYRRVAVEQVRELLTNYGPIDGLWFDIFGQQLNTGSEWVSRAFEGMYGTPYEKATGAQKSEYSLRTLAGYLDDVRALANQQQPDCVLTANGAANGMAYGGSWMQWVGARLDYGSTEGHSFEPIERLARMARICPKPIEVGTLLSSTWFAPNEDDPPPAAKTAEQAVAEVAAAVCQGASVYMALCPGHAGTFGDDLKAAKAVGAWFRQVEPLLTGARPYADVGIVLGTHTVESPPLWRTNSLWQRYGATQLGAWDEAAGMSRNLESLGYFPDLLCAWDQGGSWPPSLGEYRAILIPDLAVLDDARIAQLRQYVQEGGRLVAFGHATVLDSQGNKRASYPLADVFGAAPTDDVTFSPEAFPAGVQVDSVYHGQFPGLNLIDDEPTFWASADTPMPHWAQVDLPAPIQVAKVELVSRQGPWLVTDLDVEAYDGKSWNLVKSVRGATTKLVSIPLDKPVPTQHVRVKVLRELENHHERQIADVETLRVFDESGRNWATSRGRRFSLVGEGPEWAQAFGAASVTCGPMAVSAGTTSAQTLAHLEGEAKTPAVLRNRFGKGEAILVTTGEASFRDEPAFWSGLARLTLGEPTLTCAAKDRYRIVLTRVGGAHVLHVIDSQASGQQYSPAELSVSLNLERLGLPQTITLAGNGSPVAAKHEGGVATFALRPAPVATVVLR